MKLKTSFFDKTVFRKDILRFAPLWGLYFIGGMMILLALAADESALLLGRTVSKTLTPFSAINMVYAGLAAQLLFGDLFNSRLCNALHAMPLRRENWFATHLVSGLAYSIVPNAVGIFIIMFQMGEKWFVAPVWLLGMTLQYFFFFALAVFCVFCTGNRFAAVTVYAILNFGAYIVEWFCETVYLPLLYGVEMNAEPFALFCPVVKLFSDYENWIEWDFADNGLWRFDGFGEGWGYLWILVAIGAALLAVSLLMYRRRKLESAGDFIAVKPLAPVFSVVFTLCVGAIFSMFSTLVGGDNAPYLILGMIVGWFSAQMLLQRTVKVFRPKAFVKIGGLIALMFVSVLLLRVDAFNIIGWVPKAEDVKSVTLANYKSQYYSSSYEDGYYYGNRITLKLTEQEDIEKILMAHEDILARKDEHVYNGHRVVLTYELKNGRKVQRNYWAPADGVNYAIINDFINAPEQVFGYTDWDEYVKRVESIWFDKGDIPKDMYGQMLEALKKDCENGQVGLAENKETANWVYIEGVDEQGRHFSRQLAIHSGAGNTLELLKAPRLILGYQNWANFLEGVEYIVINGYAADPEDQTPFLLALRADCENGEVWMEDSVGEYCAKVEYSVQEKGGQYIYRYLYVGQKAENTIAWLKENMPGSM